MSSVPRVLYVAHPLRPTPEEIACEAEFARHYPHRTAAEWALTHNLNRAKAWLFWLRVTFTDVVFIAPWIGEILLGADDSDPVQRERGLRDNCSLIAKLDGVVLCGPRISSGMDREVQAFLSALDAHVPAATIPWVRDQRRAKVYDLTPFGSEPPARLPALMALPPMDHNALRELATWASPAEAAL